MLPDTASIPSSRQRGGRRPSRVTLDPLMTSPTSIAGWIVHVEGRDVAAARHAQQRSGVHASSASKPARRALRSSRD